ncbi:MAG: MFS transporter [Deltaproteobacteria bacterium]|nr:MFS transporter [Deltaproteobacteria bacterium]
MAGAEHILDGHTRGLAPALMVGVLLASLEMAIVNAVLPRIATELHDAGLLPWVFTGYIAAATVATPVFGLVADRYGRLTAYAWGMGLLLVGSGVAAWAPTMPFLLVGRVLQGLGGGAVMPVTIVILGDRYPVGERARMFGVISLVWGASTLLGPLAGAGLTGAWGWRAVFWVNLLPGAAAMWGVWRALRGEPRVSGRRPWWPSGLFRSGTQRVLNASGALAVAALYGILAHVAVWVQGVEGGDSMAAGVALLPLTLCWTAASHATGRLVGRWGLAHLLRVGAALLVVGLAVAWHWTMAPAGLGILGAGMGVLITCLNIAVQELAPAEAKGTATSTAIFLRNLGATASVPLLGHLAGFRPGMANLGEVPNLAAGVHAAAGGCLLLGAAAGALIWLGLPKRLAMP